MCSSCILQPWSALYKSNCKKNLILVRVSNLFKHEIFLSCVYYTCLKTKGWQGPPSAFTLMEWLCTRKSIRTHFIQNRVSYKRSCSLRKHVSVLEQVFYFFVKPYTVVYYSLRLEISVSNLVQTLY
jgi:hypothetical protein